MILFTNNKVSKVWQLNPDELKKIAKYTAIFFAAPVLMYLVQLQGDMNSNGIITLKDMAPNAITIVAIQGWFLGIVINFFLGLSKGSK